ncbi:MAG: hypothetical protein IPJ67_05150 [Candidatus Moraniibacteriota bacterium]|nr:MAG: hypothetical protein IPJ67_05150 [Candidatus Moranbacteria bacterium]
MLSIEEARKLLGDDGKEYTDAEVEQIRDECRILGEIIFESWMKEKNSDKQGGVNLTRLVP